MAGPDIDYLNKEYNCVAATAHFDRVGIYAERGRAALERVTRIADLVYDERSGSKLDIYPAAERGAPLFVWIHGGYWRASSKDDNIFVAPGLVEKGIAVASVDYTLAPAATIGEIVRQVRSALAWLVANAETYGYDPRRIHVGGHSAGGHLTGMLLAEGWHGDFGLREDILGAVMPISGLFELEPIRHIFVNEVLNLDNESIAANSPIRHIPKGSTAEVLLSVGGDESSEFQRQTTDYARAWSEKGNNGRLIPMPGFHHFDIILELEKPGNPLFDSLVAAIGR